MPTIQETIDAQRDESLRQLKDLLRIPSVSTDPAHKRDVRLAGEWVADKLLGAGMKTSIQETPGHPIVYGEWLEAPGKPTILVYGHYDVQPPDPLELWRHGPFEPVEEDGFLVARGSSDDKGQFFALVKGIEAALTAHGALPVNVKVLIEGEEEIGSENLRPFVAENRERLACDVVVVSDSSQFGPDLPAITYGLKGIAYLQVTVTGPSKDLHSGSFGGSVANPGNVLLRMLATCFDDEGRVTIPGFYDKVRALEPWEREAFAALPFSEAEYLAATGAKKPFGEPGYTTLERRWARPTLDVNGLTSGFQGEGAKTVLPSVASAKFSMRLVPDQDPNEIATLVSEHLWSVAPDTVSVEITDHHGAKPVIVAREGEYVAAAERALERGFGAKPVFMREGGSIPVVNVFKEELGSDTLLLGLGLPDDGAHSPNERFRIVDFHRGQAMMAAFLEEMAK